MINNREDMETFAAIGLLANILQLLGYGCKLVQNIQRVRKNSVGPGGSAQELESARRFVAAHMIILKTMEGSHDTHRSNILNESDEESKALLKEAQSKMGELTKVLDALQASDGGSTVRQFKMAVAAFGQQEKVKTLEKDLDQLLSRARSLYYMRIT